MKMLSRHGLTVRVASALTGILPLGVICAQEPSDLLSFVLDHDEVTLRWAPEPQLVLQRSRSLQTNQWETLLSTEGMGEFSEPRETGTLFYRLARLPDGTPSDLRISALEWRVIEMNLEQIRRAQDPLAAHSQTAEELPPSRNVSDERIDLFHQVRPFIWASQPGLIRVYTPRNDTFITAYKLYSSEDSIATSAEELAADADAIRAWRTAPDRFTDLNQPVVNPQGESRFPILDPRALAMGVEGFSYPDDPALGTQANVALPMPAEWLYVLADGSLGTLDSQGKWRGQGEATQANPIAARLAYWTDDETTKLNVNVASEGIPWDVPRADTPQERAYALNQPVSGEIQRYPGHPAMTSLSSVLFPHKSANHPDEDRRLTPEELRQIYALTPRAVYRDPAETPAPLSPDSDPLFRSEEAWTEAAARRGVSHTDRLHGFLTTTNPSPELTIHGAPRMSIWPVHEDTWRELMATDYDRRSAQHSTLRRRHYHFQRRDVSSRHSELYTRGDRGNIDLFRFIIDQTYLSVPGYGHSLAAKYGARLRRADYRDSTDYDKDHYAIALAMFDWIRTVNLLDPNVAEPYGGRSVGSNYGFGQASSLNLIGRDLETDNGSTDQSLWQRLTLEPQGPGRNYSLSEVALVAYVTSEVTVADWTDDGPVFTLPNGTDTALVQRILANDHPHYERWTGRRFGPEDVGKTFQNVEVGIVPEIFSPAQGYPRKTPKQTLQLITEGRSYRGGFDEAGGLSLNGVPLRLWGESLSNVSPDHGPLLSTQDPAEVTLRDSLPMDWITTGGMGGPRLFRFGTFELTPSTPGWVDARFLPNGAGPLSLWYCQSPVVIEKGADLVFTQSAPITAVLYDQAVQGASTGNAIRLFHWRFAQPDEALSVPGPEFGPSPQYLGWTRRFGGAVAAKEPLLEPGGSEAVKGLSVSHGDYRHVAVKRIVPSELFVHHPLAEEERASHTLAWAVRGGTDIESTAKQGPETIGRSLVEGVDYAREILPDFVGDPTRRQSFAPLLGESYHFPIDPTITRDFDNGLGRAPDGPYINTPDGGEDEVPGNTPFTPKTPYFDLEPVMDFKFAGIEPLHHFARRMTPSPVAFGSLPSAAQANAPWTCLLFRPNVSDPTLHPHLGEHGNAMTFQSNRTTLDGLEVPQMASVTGDLTYPPDHLWLDLFWMPEAETTHISRPFATQGKVNLNYQMFPFTYIKRATALHAALKAEELLAIPTDAGPTYKTSIENPNWRRRIDAEETLKAFEDTFARGDIFMTASEICQQFLIPEGEVWDPEGAAMRRFWDRHRLTGDNTLERPYAGLYPRLTTQSNAYRLHYRIQRITKSQESPPDTFDASLDTVIADHRGSKILEQVLDTSSKDLPDYLSNTFSSTPRLEAFYRFVIHDR